MMSVVVPRSIGPLGERLEPRLLLAGPDVTSLTLYNAETGQAIGALNDNSTLDYRLLPTRKLSVRANANTTGSVRFGLDGNANFRTENGAPFEILGELPGGKPAPWTPAKGSHVLTVTAYSGDNATGEAGPAITISFTVVDDDLPPPPPPPGVVVSFIDADANASESGDNTGEWRIGRTGSTAQSLVVALVVGGTATNGVDYTMLPGSITIPAGSSSVPVTLAGKTDGLIEGNETVLLTIGPGAYAIGSASTATGTITDGNTIPPRDGRITGVSWSTSGVPRSPLQRTEAMVVQVGSKVYTMGGFVAGFGSFPITRRVHVFDMATNVWKELAPLPGEAAANHGGIASDGQYIYVVSGQIQRGYGAGTSSSWRYDIARNTWSRFVSLPQIRFGGALAFIGGKLRFVGGAKSDRSTPSGDHWELDLSSANPTWVSKAPLPRAGDHFSHATVNGQLYIIGGEHGHASTAKPSAATYVQHSEVYRYNESSNTWTKRASMPFASSHFEAATFVIGSQVLIVGGLLTGGGDHMTRRVRLYDTVSDNWVILSSNYPKRTLGNTAGYFNGKLYITDGYSPDQADRSVGYRGTLQFSSTD
jgi:hypothetical protein